MKKTFLNLLFIAFATLAQAQNKDLLKVFEKHQESKGVTSIKISKPMFKLIDKFNIKNSEFKNLKPLLNNVNSINLLEIEKTLSNSDADKISQEINLNIKELKYQELASIKHETDKIKFLSKDTQSEKIQDLILSISKAKNDLFILIEGELNTQDVAELINTVENKK